MTTKIMRRSHYTRATLVANTSETPAVWVGEFNSCAVVTPATWSGCHLSFKGTTHESGTFVPVYDRSGAQVQVFIAASRGSRLPDDVLAFRWVKMVSQSGSTAVTQGADKTLGLSLKG